MLPSSNAWTTLAPWSLGREMPQEVNPGDAEPCRSIMNPCANESISGKESTGKLYLFYMFSLSHAGKSYIHMYIYIIHNR